MDLYGKLIDGVLEYAPKTYTLEDGRIICNFSNSPALMKRYGYKPIVDVQPEYDINIEYVIIVGYEETEENIIVKYTVKTIETMEEVDVVANINTLRNTDTEHEEAISEIYALIMDLMGGNL